MQVYLNSLASCNANSVVLDPGGPTTKTLFSGKRKQNKNAEYIRMPMPNKNAFL